MKQMEVDLQSMTEEERLEFELARAQAAVADLQTPVMQGAYLRHIEELKVSQSLLACLLPSFLACLLFVYAFTLCLSHTHTHTHNNNNKTPRKKGKKKKKN